MTIKIALVTGGSRGLGKDMALSLAKKGIDVILTYNAHKMEAEKVVSQISSRASAAIIAWQRARKNVRLRMIAQR